MLIPPIKGLGITGSIELGTTALVTSDQIFKLLSQQIDQDLYELETSILISSLDSLVILQN